MNNPGQHTSLQLDGQATLNQSVQRELDLRDVKGQAQARRALEIAAAGGHNLFLS